MKSLHELEGEQAELRLKIKKLHSQSGDQAELPRLLVQMKSARVALNKIRFERERSKRRRALKDIQFKSSPVGAWAHD